ncbi:MAG: PAS domain S-box protein [Gemmatimonadaceae bacterium]|nr:PAS domain S-box protein [Gemmatimonadaceae bacterium]
MPLATSSRLVARLEWLASQMDTGVVITDAPGNVLWVNEGFRRMTGYELTELVGRRPGPLLQGPDTDAATVRVMHDALEHERPFLVEVLNYSRDGSPYWVSIDCHPLRDAQGALEGFIALEIDITARRTAEQRVHDSEQRYRSLFEHAHDAILVANDAGAYVDANPAALRMLGYTREELLGLTVTDLIPPAEALPAWRSFEADGAQRGELVLRRRDGQRRTVEYNAVRDFLPGLHLSMLRDVTDRRLTEMRSRRSDRLEALGTLAGGIAHDFNNILTGMLGELAVLQEELRSACMTSAATAPTMRRADASIASVLASGERARDLIRRILSFSRMHEPSQAPLALNPVVHEASRLLRALLPSMVELRVDLPETSPWVNGDATALHQIVTNLVTNSWHALPAVGGVIDVRVQVLSTRPDRESLALLPSGPVVCLSVRDNGHGMDADTQARIFEPLFTTKPAGEGTGLGLAAVQSMVDAHGGIIDVSSTVGHGTTFSIWLPAIASPEPRSGTPGGVAAVRPAHTGRVVLADDDAQTRAALERMLRHLGFSVEAYGDPREVLARISASPDTLDVLLTDLSMPGMTGEHLVTSVRAVRADLPVIVLSGFLAGDVRARLDAIGVPALDKPPSLDMLSRALVRVRA